MMRFILIILIFFAAGCTGADKKAQADETVIETNINGEILFKANCASCHKPDMDFTAPALKKALLRWDGKKKLMYDFIRNPSQSENAYAKAIKKKWRPALMTSFPTLTDAEIDAIMKYVEK